MSYNQYELETLAHETVGLHDNYDNVKNTADNMTFHTDMKDRGAWWKFSDWNIVKKESDPQSKW